MHVGEDLDVGIQLVVHVGIEVCIAIVGHVNAIRVSRRSAQRIPEQRRHVVRGSELLADVSLERLGIRRAPGTMASANRRRSCDERAQAPFICARIRYCTRIGPARLSSCAASTAKMYRSRGMSAG